AIVMEMPFSSNCATGYYAKRRWRFTKCNWQSRGKYSHHCKSAERHKSLANSKFGAKKTAMPLKIHAEKLILQPHEISSIATTSAHLCLTTSIVLHLS